MRIIVIGAGIVGLVAAAALQRDGHDVTVHERRPNLDPAGAGITLFQNSFEALDLVGLGEAVRNVSSDAIASMRAGQRRPSGKWLLSVPPGSAPPVRSVHRTDLHRALAGSLAEGTVHTNSPAMVSADARPILDTPEGTQHADLVIVADGIRSPNRELLGLNPGLRYSGYTAWRGVTASPVDIHDSAGETWGRGRLFGIVPLPDDRVYWFGTHNAPAGSTFRDELDAVHRLFGDWHSPIPELIRTTPAENLIRHDVFDLARPLTTYTTARTVLIGDAAHGMTPNLGQGAGQSIEDAATLAVLLRETSPDDVDTTLSSFNELRHGRTTAIMKRSRMVGRVAQASNPVLVALRNAALRLTPGATMAKTSRQMMTWPRPTS